MSEWYLDAQGVFWSLAWRYGIPCVILIAAVWLFVGWFGGDD